MLVFDKVTTYPDDVLLQLQKHELMKTYVVCSSILNSSLTKNVSILNVALTNFFSILKTCAGEEACDEIKRKRSERGDKAVSCNKKISREKMSKTR